ncbi:MAG: hypothetical protein U9Q03_00375 [Patescibacteria group bacterium]|nr:hypothetical protein [Patescibacteria group bacterium]
MSWEQILIAFFAGFTVKFIASLDDTITKVPVISHITRTRMGKVAFSIGNLLAVLVVIALAAFLSFLFADFEYFHLVAGGLVLVMAIVTMFGVFPGARPQKKKDWPFKNGIISTGRFIMLMMAGFTVSLITLIDDIAAMIPLYGSHLASAFSVTAGIVVATLIQLVLVIYFSSFLDRLPRKREIAGGGLAIYGILIILGIL